MADHDSIELIKAITRLETRMEEIFKALQNIMVEKADKSIQTVHTKEIAELQADMKTVSSKLNLMTGGLIVLQIVLGIALRYWPQ
jgi:hypothetical protein